MFKKRKLERELKKYATDFADDLINTIRDVKYTPVLAPIDNEQPYDRYRYKEAHELTKKLVEIIKNKLESSLGRGEITLASEMGDIGERLVDDNDNFEKKGYEKDLIALVSNPYFMFRASNAGYFDTVLLLYYPKDYRLPQGQDTLRDFCIKLAFKGKKYYDMLRKDNLK